MTKTKKSVGLKLLLCVMFVACFMAMFVGFGTTKAYAAAATTPKYTVYFGYTAWYKSNTSTSTIASASSVSGATLPIGQSATSTYSVELWGSSSSGTGTLRSDDYINSSTVNIKLNSSSGSPTLTIKNSSGTVVGSGTGTVTMTGLADGTYTGTFGASGGWLVNNRQYDQKGFDATFTFNIDTVKPTISGASTSTTGKYTNSEFTVTASDSRSGIAYLYFKTPSSDSYYTTTSNSKTITASTYPSGLYSFYAVDKAGNKTDTYYVVLDEDAPTGTIKSSSGTTLTGTYTNGAFSYSATDEYSGLSYLQYKTPSSSSWTTYTSGTTISASATNGKYSFRAVDKCNNISAEKSIYLDTTKPTGTLYSGNTTVSSGATSQENFIKFIPSDALSGVKATYVKMPNTSSYVAYTSGSPLTELGAYSFYCVDNANNQSSTYTISLAESHVHSYSASVISPTCTGGGYTLNSCSCGASYTDNTTTALGHSYSDWTMVNATSCTSSGTRKAYCTRCNETKTETVTSLGHSYTEIVSSTGNSCTSAGTTVYKCSRCSSTQTVTGTALGHNYRATTTAATCTNGGYMTNTCSRCGDSYVSSITSSLGHNYIRSVAEATCTDGGGVKHTCSRCYDSYMTDVTLPLGHAYVESVIEPTCTAKGFVLHSCARCGNEYKTDEVLPTGHQYSSNVIATASCEGTGERYHSCEYCGDNYTTQIAATGHNYEIVQENNRNGTIYRVYACSVCGNSYTEELGEQYAEVSNYVVYLMDEYKPYMVWVFLATAGVWSIAMGVAMIIAHKNEDKDKAKKMLVNYLVGMVAIFCILVACPFLVRGIAVLVS